MPRAVVVDCDAALAEMELATLMDELSVRDADGLAGVMEVGWPID